VHAVAQRSLDSPGRQGPLGWLSALRLRDTRHASHDAFLDVVTDDAGQLSVPA
jgi:hypothetical protein